MSSGNVIRIVAFGMISMTPISLVAEDGWTTRADMPTARSGLTTSVVEGRVYAIGGAQASASSFRNVEESTQQRIAGWKRPKW